jgi:hypothetical protein
VDLEAEHLDRHLDEVLENLDVGASRQAGPLRSPHRITHLRDDRSSLRTIRDRRDLLHPCLSLVPGAAQIPLGAVGALPFGELSDTLATLGPGVEERGLELIVGPAGVACAERD